MMPALPKDVALTRRVAVDQRDLHPAFGQRERCADADDTGAKDGDFLCHGATLPGDPALDDLGQDGGGGDQRRDQVGLKRGAR
ncbi:MAG: hypothetical protein R3D61_05510 [Defluviimonas denitrificans]